MDPLFCLAAIFTLTGFLTGFFLGIWFGARDTMKQLKHQHQDKQNELDKMFQEFMDNRKTQINLKKDT